MENEQKNKKLSSILNAFLIVFYGVIVLINSSNILPISETIGNWYELLILLFACMCIVNMILKKAPQYVMLIIFFAGLYLYLHLSRRVNGYGYVRLWAMIPFFIGLSIIVSYLSTKGNSGFLNFGVLTFLFACIFLFASLTNTYKYVVPSIIIAVGIYSFIKTLTGKKIKLLSEEDKKEKLRNIRIIRRK
jgi:hypothetical protein